MVSAAHYLLPDSEALDSTDSRTLAPMPDFNQQQSKVYQLVPDSIYDGDTLRVSDGAGELKIRLCGIDAPEKEQPMGVEARDHLRGLIGKGDGTIIVVPVEKDRYGRMVAELFVKPRSQNNTGEEIAVNAQMVIDGYAHHYDRYSGNCPNGQMLSRFEISAKQQGLGVWKNGDAVRPWDYRKSH
jgi:endonuclease YncB( thermonuclease family)